MIRNAIKKALAGRAWSAYKLAQLADIPSNNVYAFLKGKDTLSLAKVEALLSLLDLVIEPSPLADEQDKDIPTKTTGEVGFIDLNPPHWFGLVNCDADGKFITGI